MRMVILFVFLVTLQSCDKDGGKSDSNLSGKPTQVVSPATKSESESYKLPAQVAVSHVFSDPNREDLFILRSEGSYPGNAVIHFTITASNGQTLYAEDFKASVLLNADKLADVATPGITDEGNNIAQNMQTFFSEANFSVPAIADDADFVPEYSDKAIWDEIKKDKTAVGFYYLLGTQTGRSIAWSKKQKKVVTYFSCC
ncbi:hypothetical protein C7N43_26080 [Sphingobacteriales bacterium UPWRP_1]|nr:hypothetical protein B6N25_13405 [Sphingobacteriales bacterium TSM_CSS]PSJ74030.1 hypothetical protein C7N43_26080 [Sphingobacteriales bacterium UPWRP_1]